MSRRLRRRCWRSWPNLCFDYVLQEELKMSELIFLVEEAPEGGFTARALGQAIFTEADDLPSLREQIRDAVRCHFEEEQQPAVIRLHSIHEGLRSCYVD